MSSDEYSSDEEESPKSQVYLGFVDAPISAEEPATLEDTFIGGQPIWFNSKSAPPIELVSCKNCASPMALLLQAFSPMEGTFYDRIIYIFACKKSSCRRKKGCIRAIRAVCKDPKIIAANKQEVEASTKKELDEKLQAETQKKLEIELTKDLFTSKGYHSSNAFGDSPNPFGSSNPFSAPPKAGPKVDPKKTYAEAGSKAAPPPKPEPVRMTSALPEYPGSFIYVKSEKFHKKKQELPKDFKIDQEALDTDAEPSGGKGDDPKINEIVGMMDDTVFQKFAETVSYNPSQILRHDLGGVPLLYSSKDDVAKVFAGEPKIPNPGYNPSSVRHFELQLMPKAIIDLEKDETDIMLNGMEWGTIIVATDVEDFVPKLDENHVGYVEEWCGVQWEESK